MSGAAFMRLKKLKGQGIWSKAPRHNKRTIQAELGASGHIDATRSHMNITITGPAAPEEVTKLAKAKMNEAGITKERKNGVLGVELVFSLPTNHQQDVIKYFSACANWAGVAFGGLDNIVSVDIHRDEAQDHAHVLLVPIIDGRLRGSDAIGGKRDMSELQVKFYKDVASCFGFEKPRSKLNGNHKAHITRQVLGKLRNDPAAKSAAWAPIRDTVERDPMPYALALGIDTTPPAKPAKTMAQIFTSTGKGRKKENTLEIQTRKPYRVSPSSQPQTLGLCRVSVSPPLPSKASPAFETASKTPQAIRVRDCEQDPSRFDLETGEYWEPAHSNQSQRQHTEAWVEGELKRLGAKV